MPIRFYYDFISPNAYLGWTQLAGLTSASGRSVELHPVLFAGLLKAHDRFGPAEIPPVRDWMFRNCVRKAAALDVSLNPPAHHPFNPLLPLRLVSAIDDRAERATWTERLFRGVWVESLDLSDGATLATFCTAQGGDAESLLRGANSDAAKLELRRSTDAAIDAGVFGVPSLEIDGEIFWGFDDFPQAAQQLRGIDPLDANRRRIWESLTPSAVRREANARER